MGKKKSEVSSFQNFVFVLLVWAHWNLASPIRRGRTVKKVHFDSHSIAGRLNTGIMMKFKWKVHIFGRQMWLKPAVWQCVWVCVLL